LNITAPVLVRDSQDLGDLSEPDNGECLWNPEGAKYCGRAPSEDDNSVPAGDGGDETRSSSSPISYDPDATSGSHLVRDRTPRSGGGTGGGGTGTGGGGRTGR
jgi:hypothetical protein